MIINIKRFVYYCRVKSAVRQAKRLHKLTKRHYYVIQLNHKINVLDRRQINSMVDAGIFVKSMKEDVTLQKFAIYNTKIA